MTEELSFVPALDHPELLASTVASALKRTALDLSKQVMVAEIDPQFAGGEKLCEHHNLSQKDGANCVVVKATRASSVKMAACVFPVGERLDLNKAVRKKLEARRVSLAPLDEVIELSKMEYGSITAFGLPSEWTILIDETVSNRLNIIIGSGKLRSKLKLPTVLLTSLSNAEVLKLTI